MAQRYRLVRLNASHGPNDQRMHGQQRGDDRREDQESVVVSPRRHTAAWIMVSLVAVVIIVLAFVWMSGVGSSLDQVNRVVHRNTGLLSSQQYQLTGMQAQLHALGNQLNQIQADMRTFFTNLLQAIHHG